MKKEYTWETEKRDYWRNGTHESIQECIDEYKQSYGEPFQKTIFIGECERFAPCVDSRAVIERLEEQAYNDCGECAEDWNPSGIKDITAWEELDNQLTAVVVAWLEKYKEIPSFYSVINVVEVAVEGSED